MDKIRLHSLLEWKTQSHKYPCEILNMEWRFVCRYNILHLLRSLISRAGNFDFVNRGWTYFWRHNCRDYLARPRVSIIPNAFHSHPFQSIQLYLLKNGQQKEDPLSDLTHPGQHFYRARIEMMLSYTIHLMSFEFFKMKIFIFSMDFSELEHLAKPINASGRNFSYTWIRDENTQVFVIVRFCGEH